MKYNIYVDKDLATADNARLVYSVNIAVVQVNDPSFHIEDGILFVFNSEDETLFIIPAGKWFFVERV